MSDEQSPTAFRHTLDRLHPEIEENPDLPSLPAKVVSWDVASLEYKTIGLHNHCGYEVYLRNIIGYSGKSGDSTHVNFNAKHTKINSDGVNFIMYETRMHLLEAELGQKAPLA